MASAHHGVPVEHAPCAPHQITLRILTHSREEASCGGLTAVHRSDALRRLFRLMVAEGLSGPAEVRGGDGKLRMTVRSIEGAARLTLSEEDRDGFRLRRCPAELPGWHPASASQSVTGNSPTAHA